ncbi:protein IN2-1 homolog B-like isoform X2 [Humulus lupulus]|uniref:protein IN2-1 homolog B-like isoform X2 n=1 Tax=Humulus lupulus TaxID=3486 RepID=UPI002B40795C|nr:protein IN2-1 homolog B-like isoform X2 [Humulus lupulus]
MATFKASVMRSSTSNPGSTPLIISSFPNNNIKFSVFIKLPKPKLFSTPKLQFQVYFGGRSRRTRISSAAMATGVQEVRTPALSSTSDPPKIFDGKTRLYIAYVCPYAQRVWITRNCKGLQEKIELVPLDLQDRPAWYKEKVYPSNKVPALEHNNEVIGESLDLIKYLDSHFEGPSLLPDDPAKKEFAEELLSNTDSFNKSVFSSFKGDVNEAVSAFDLIETALSKFDDGPFFLGQFSLVDIAYVPFIERFQPFLSEVMKYDITAGRPNLKIWIEEMNNIEGYKPTRSDPKEIISSIKKRFSIPK